jgi:outer membrane protein assembly factor BamB
VLVNPQGEKQFSMKLDLPVETPAVAPDLNGNGRLSIVAVDVLGSLYCFDEQGKRQWKYPRAVKSGEYRLPVLADLDGDGSLEIIVADSRGTMQVIDAQGRLRLEIAATKYRLSVPAVGDVNRDGKPELIFGTEGGEIYCINARGDALWAAMADGCFGRALPLIADADRNGTYEVYFPTAFNNAHPGLFALDTRTGQPLWKAASVLQSYRSTVVADLDGDGRNEILFGDKNSSLFCLDDHGQQRWTVQLPGRGIFFAPAIADLEGDGQATSFVVVRSAGSNGKSLYALHADGHILDELALPGGGSGSPILCRFQGSSEISLAVVSTGGQLLCFRLKQNPTARILWPGTRNDVLNSGFIKSNQSIARGAPPPPWTPKPKPISRRALGGTNPLPVSRAPPGCDFLSIKTVRPDQSVHLDMVHPQPDSAPTSATFAASMPGDYDVTLRWHGTNGLSSPAEHFLCRVDRDFKEDAAQLDKLIGVLKELGEWAPALSSLLEYFQNTAKSLFAQARNTRAIADFDNFHQSCDYFLRLTRYCCAHKYFCNSLLHQLPNPWEKFDVAGFLRRDSSQPAVSSANVIAVSLLANAYESAAIALSNLSPRPATYRLVCEPFQFGTNRIAASHVLTLHEVLSVRPDGTGEQTEDPLPLLGESQTVRLDAGETRKLWLSFNSHSLPPGEWRATLKIGDVAAAEPPMAIPLTVEVSPVRLPERFTYRECNWLYLDSIRDDALREATLRDALEHGMNVFVIPGVSVQVDDQGRLGQANSTAHDQLVRKLQGRAFFLVSGPVSVQWPAQSHPGVDLQEKTFAEALHWYAAHMRELGCDYDDYALYLQDEPGLLGRDAGFEAFVAQVKRFKAADPRIQLYANPAGGARAEPLRPLQDLIDVWAPDLHLVREQPEELTRLFQHAKHYWHYEAPGDQRLLDPLGFYRVKPWVAFQMGMTGGGYWVYSSADFWTANPGGGSEYGSVYPTDKGPVTTKRWEASRAGIQDFELLWLLRNTANRSSSPARKEALALLEEAVQFVTRGQEKVTDISRHVRPYTPDYQRWMSYRRQLIQMQARLMAEQ